MFILTAIQNTSFKDKIDTQKSIQPETRGCENFRIVLISGHYVFSIFFIVI